MSEGRSAASRARPTRRDLTASIVVFLVALPLCMGIAIAGGMPAASGLISGIVGGLVVGALAGSPLQVSGPAAGLTVLVFDVVRMHGIERLGIVVLAAGLFQIAFGLLRFGIWFRAVSPAVVHGMLAGIGVLILAGQFHVMVDDQPKATGWQNLLTIPLAVEKGLPPPALETAEQRSAVRLRMQRLSDLHLRQLELGEEVHHALAGIGAESADERTRQTLRELASRQRSIVEELTDLEKSTTNDASAAATIAARRALETLEQGNWSTARAEIDAAEAAVGRVRDTTKHHRWAAAVGLLTIAVLVAWQAFSPARFNAVPGALVATIAASAAAVWLQLPVLFVEVPPSPVDEIFFPRRSDFTALFDPAIFGAALELALLASAETLLCATAVDRLHHGPRTDYDRELMAQGVGNLVCGMLRALPVSGVIVRSSANVAAGAQTRASTMLHGLWLLAAAAAFTDVLRLVPTSALAAVLVYTGFKLVSYDTLTRLWRQNRFEAYVYLGTAGGIVVFGLLQGVVFGLALSVARLLYEFSRLEIDVETDPVSRQVVMRLRGNVTFLTLPRLAQTLEALPPETELALDVEYVDYFDHACRDLLSEWERKSAPAGGRLLIDQRSLTARFWRRPQARNLPVNGTPTPRPKRERQVPI